MTLLFLTDNFPPEFNAPATRTFEHCKEWVKQGHRVVVITGFPNFPMGKVYDGYRNKLYAKEVMEGITVIRIWTFIAPNQGTLRRTFDFLSYAIGSFFCGLFVKCDIIVATSPQFFTAVSGYFLSIFKFKKWVMEVRDIWPESIKAVNAIDTNAVIRFLEKVELFLYRRASKVAVVTESFKEIISARGIDGKKIFVVKNGVDLSHFTRREKDQVLLDELGLSGKFVVGYIGTHGLAHGLDFIIKTAAKLTDKSIHFLFIGDGAEKENAIKRSVELQLSNVTFLAPVAKNRVPDYLSLIDVALVPLRKSSTFESVIPSKIFETAAMGKPILLGVKGETRRIIEQYQAGVAFEPEEALDFIEKLTALKCNLSRNPRHYEAGCLALAMDYDRKKLAIKMIDELQTIVTPKA